METSDADARDREDMQRLAAGHEAALNDLMERHAAPIFHFLCRMVGNEDDANDLAQETFARVFRARASFRPGEKFSTWLYTIAANLARNHFRWRSRHPNIPLDPGTETREIAPVATLVSAEPTPREAAHTSERAVAVRRAVSALPDDMREAIVMCELEERTLADAAVILGVTPKAVESRLYRARQILRARLKEWL